jgi:hypothetical protein
LSAKKGEFEVNSLNKTLVIFLLILCLSFLPSRAVCAVYGYVDEKGVYHFTTNSCPEGRTCRLIISDTPKTIRKNSTGPSSAKKAPVASVDSFTWPRWTGPKPPMPKPNKEGEQTPAGLFRTSSVSVYTVVATSSENTELKKEGNVAIGSAVAISSNQLITNCHIVEARSLNLYKARRCS